MDGQPPAVAIDIGVLQIEGIARPEVARLQRDVERELARLFERNGVPASLIRPHSTDVIAIDLPRPGPGAAIGAETTAAGIADAIYRGLGG